jgi:hypothetical protein
MRMIADEECGDGEWRGGSLLKGNDGYTFNNFILLK